MNEHDKKEVMNLIKFKKILNTKKCKKCKYYYIAGLFRGHDKEDIRTEMCMIANKEIDKIPYCTLKGDIKCD